MAAARTANAAGPRPGNCEARNTDADGKAARAKAEAPPAHDTKTAAPGGTCGKNAAHAARQPAPPEREPPKPNEEKEASGNMTTQQKKRQRNEMQAGKPHRRKDKKRARSRKSRSSRSEQKERKSEGET